MICKACGDDYGDGPGVVHFMDGGKGSFCPLCGCDPSKPTPASTEEYRRIVADAPETKREHGEMLAMLRRIQWSGTTIHGDESGCPSCREHPDHGHSAVCDLGNLIARIDERNAKR